MNFLKLIVSIILVGVSIQFSTLAIYAQESEKLATANNSFAFDLLKQIEKEQPRENIFISPFSVSTALQMVGNGAAGETKAEIQRVLGTGSLPPDKLNAASWQDDILPQFGDREGTLMFPKFKLEYGVRLNDSLEALGMKSAFTTGANFSAMSDELLFISEVKQKSFIEMNEEGTEAAAVTGFGFSEIGPISPPQPPFEMTVDRPFFFMIADERIQSILFMGIIFDPAN